MVLGVRKSITKFLVAMVFYKKLGFDLGDRKGENWQI